MQQHMLSPGPGSLIVLPQCYDNFTGFPAANHLQPGDMTFKCLHSLPPLYMAYVCIPVSSVVGRWQRRSADNGTLVVPRNRTTTAGRRDFAVSSPATRNSLLVELRSCTFAKKLKTHLLAGSASEDSQTLSNAVITIAIQLGLRSDYDVSRAPASIRRDSTRAKKEHVIFSS